MVVTEVGCACADGPKFTGAAGHAAVDLAEDATLTCEVDGNPQPAIIWRKKGQWLSCFDAIVE